MSIMFVVATSDALRPDPDEASSPVATLDPSDLISVEKTLGSWSKVTLNRAGKSISGWLNTADLVPVEQATVKLYDEPLGALLQTLTGHVEVVVRVATWAKVKVTLPDGSPPSIGWTEDAGPAPPPPQAGPADPAAASEDASSDDDLILGANERYRAALLQAESITKIDAAALAALIDAEAAKINGGADAGVWDAACSNDASGAVGLTQFLEGTWCDMACRPGTFLNKAARKAKMVSSENQIVPGLKSRLLALRSQPDMSIVTAAEYGLGNLKALVKDGLLKDDVGDDEQAWYIYLAHHEGLGGAEHFLRGDETIPFSRLAAQVGTARANQLAVAAGGDVTIAYRKWLTGYMDQKIQPSRFRAAKAPAVKPAAQAARALGTFDGPPIALDSLPGARLDVVLEVQQALSNLGYLDPPPDGFMGPTTKWALAQFCALNDLSLADGFTRDIAAALLKPSKLLPDIRPSGAWIDRVIAYMIGKNHFICRHPDCKNILYVEGIDPDGTLNPQTPNVFEDLRVVLSIGKDGLPLVQSWVATTRPGREYTMDPMNPKGAAQIAPGQYKAWHVGTHVGASGFDPHEALVQAAPIDIYRDTNRDFRREGPIFTGMFGIDQHWGYDQQTDDIGRASAGCLVGVKRDGHRAFMAVIKSDPRYLANNGYKFVTAVVPGREALAA